MGARVFIQSEFLVDIAVLDVDPTTTTIALRETILGRFFSEQPPEVLFLFAEDGAEEWEAAASELVMDGMRLHVHRLKHVEVQVRYGGHDVTRTFRPGTTVGTVKHWSTHALGIPPADAAELMLQIAGTEQRPDSDIHLGSLVHAPNHHICFDLVPSPRING